MTEMALKMNAFEPLTMDEMMAVDGGRKKASTKKTTSRKAVAGAVRDACSVVGAGIGITAILGSSSLGCAGGAAIVAAAANPIGGALLVGGIVAGVCYSVW